MHNFFTNGLDNRSDFEPYNDAVNAAAGYTTDQNGNSVYDIPSYDWHSGYYRDPKGNIVDDNEVFSNFVEPNSVSVTDVIFTGTSDNPYQNFRGVYLSDGSSWWTGNAPIVGGIGSAGGRDNLMIDPIGPGSNKYYEPNIMEMIINNKTRQGVSFAVGLESAMLSIATYGNKAKTVRQVSKASNYVGAAVGMADSYFSAQQAIMQGNLDRARFESMQFIIYGVGAGMIRTKRFPGLGNGIIFVNGLVDLGQYYYDGN